MSTTPAVPIAQAPRLRRPLSLWDLILYGMIVIQPTAPMPVYGVMTPRAHGIWMLLGIAYGAVKTRGFKAELVTFEVPEDPES